MHRSKGVQVAGFIGWQALSFLAAAIGGIASADAPEFYRQLARPEWAPPSQAFGPVWTVLFALMGASAWLVWVKAGVKARPVLALFAVQLVFNALWSWCFFVWRSGAWAFADAILLWLLVLATMIAFWRFQKWASVLLLPYLCWVAYAVALTYSVWQRNPQLL